MPQPNDDKVILQQENLILKQEIQKLKSTIRAYNIQTINANYQTMA